MRKTYIIFLLCFAGAFAQDDLSTGLTLINTGTDTDPVTLHSYSQQEDTNGKTNFASNTIDKDLDTDWAAQDGALVSGDYKGDGEYIIYDLGGEYNLDLVQFITTNKTEAFGYQIWVSTTGTVDSDFTKTLPVTDDILLTAVSSEAYNQYSVDVVASYVKVIGFGRYNTAGDTRTSAWSAMSEIEFYGESSSLSTEKVSLDQLGVQLFPNPVVNDVLFVDKKVDGIESVVLYDVTGKVVLTQSTTSNSGTEEVNLSILPAGMYFVQITKGKSVGISKVVVK